MMSSPFIHYSATYSSADSVIVKPNKFHSTAPLLAVDYGTYNYVNFDTYLHFDAVTVSHPENWESVSHIYFQYCHFNFKRQWPSCIEKEQLEGHLPNKQLKQHLTPLQVQIVYTHSHMSHRLTVMAVLLSQFLIGLAQRNGTGFGILVGILVGNWSYCHKSGCNFTKSGFLVIFGISIGKSGIAVKSGRSRLRKVGMASLLVCKG